MIVAIFDLDGTLYTGHIIEGIARHHRMHRVQRRWLYLYMATHLALWPLYALRLVPEEALRDLWSRHLGWTVRGWTPQQAAAAFAWIATHYVRPLLRPGVIARLRAHQSGGHRILLVSGTPAPLLAEIGHDLQVEETVGTPLVLRDGRYTGSCELPVCQGKGKVARLAACLQDVDAVDWAGSYVYADSYTDLPLFQQVGHPVAVHPDARLKAYALAHGWEVIEGETGASSRRSTKTEAENWS
jgi:HAD superfamily hydrolase (TIGR01490 family)